jgi:hypothetical protein
MALSIRLSNPDFDHVQIIIDHKKLEALENALDYSSRALELSISDLEKLSLIDGVMQTGINATIARESIETYKKAIEIIEELSAAIYNHLLGFSSEEWHKNAIDRHRAKAASR